MSATISDRTCSLLLPSRFLRKCISKATSDYTFGQYFFTRAKSLSEYGIFLEGGLGSVGFTFSHRWRLSAENLFHVSSVREYVGFEDKEFIA